MYTCAGNPLHALHYAPYGEPFEATGTPQMPHGFTGEPTDANGLVYLRARYYVPSLGVFPSLDPVEDGNRYAYVAGNVVNRVDPSGMVGETPEKWSFCFRSSDPCHDVCRSIPIFGSVPSYFQACVESCHRQLIEGVFPQPSIPPSVPRCKVFFAAFEDFAGAAFASIGFDIVVPFRGTKRDQAQRAFQQTARCMTMNIIGYSKGADSSIIFAHLFPQMKITGLGLLGPTLSGNAGGKDINDDESSNMAIWQRTLAGLISGGTFVYILNDNSQFDTEITMAGRDLHSLLSQFRASTGNGPYLRYVNEPLLDHFGGDATSVNNDPQWVMSAYSFVSQGTLSY